MLSIDEAIAHEREVANTQKGKSGICLQNGLECEHFSDCLKCAEEHEQLAEWLEELKAYREIGTVEGYKNAIECYTKEYTIRKSNVQYDKAVDDFVHECDKHCEFYSGKNKNITREDILKIAEQLKERNNDKENKSSKKV